MQLTIYILLGLALAPSLAHAWSLETHLYIGASVLRDVMQDDRVGLCVSEREQGDGEPDAECDDRRALPAEVASALRAHPDAYLAGTLGPDVYPDFITAQVTVHPGVKDGGWQTDEWLGRLLERAATPEELAWAYGYVTHAASDVFAHTWANRYAGEIFDIGEHEGAGNEAELRHFLLERYIAWRTPEEWEPFGENRPGPLSFIADQLIFDRDVVSQYRKQGLPLHLVAMAELRRGVAEAHQGAKDLASKILENGLQALSPLRHAEQALQGAELGLQGAQAGVKAAQDALAARDRLISEGENKLIELAKIIDDNPGIILGLRQQIEVNKIALQGARDGIGHLQDLVDGAAREVQRLADILINTAHDVEQTVCDVLPWPLNTVCNTVMGLNPAWSIAEQNLRDAQVILDQHRQHLKDAQDLIASLEETNAGLEQRIRDLEQAISDAKIAQTAVKTDIDVHRTLREGEQKALEEAQRALAAAEEEVRKAREKVAELNGKLKPVADFLADYDFLVAYLGHWEADIGKAAVAFVGAGEEIAARIVEKSEESRLEPYRDWLDCWAPVLTAIPSEVPQTVCTAKEEYEKLKEKLDAELNRIADQLGSFGWLILPGVKLQQEFDKHVRKPLEQEVDKAIVKARHELIAFVGNQDLAFLVDSIDSKDRVTGTRLNEVFETDDSHQGLLTFPDISQRVGTDTGMSGDDDEVEAERFNALFNALQLSKLAVLDARELNTLVQDLEGGAARQRAPLFQEGGRHFSLLLDAVRSIDGNEQWQHYALPYPRSEGQDGVWPLGRQYGRGVNEGGGFRLWTDQVARELVFKRLFRGPVSPGIEAHPLYAANFPFPACEAHPFPVSTRDNGTANEDGDRTCRLLTLSEASGEPGKFGALSTTPFRRRDLAGLSGWDLRIARNEIFARYGYRFGPPELMNYFAFQPWYTPNQMSPSQISEMLTEVEWHNVMLIRRLEAGRRIARPVSDPRFVAAAVH